MGTELVPFYVQHSLKQLKVLPSQTLKKVIKVLYQKPQLKAGSQYNASAAYRHLPSVSITDSGIDQSSIPLSVTVDDGTHRYRCIVNRPLVFELCSHTKCRLSVCVHVVCSCTCIVMFVYFMCFMCTCTYVHVWLYYVYVCCVCTIMFKFEHCSTQ